MNIFSRVFVSDVVPPVAEESDAAKVLPPPQILLDRTHDDLRAGKLQFAATSGKNVLF